MIDVVTEPLAKRAEVVRGVTFSKRDAVGEPLEGYMPVLRAGNIQSSLLLDDNLVFVPKNKITERQFIRSGDIVMCTSSGSVDIVGKTAYAYENWDGSFGAFCAVVRPKVADCDPRYLYHYLQSPAFRHWTQNSSGANIKNIRKTELDALEIPFPRLSEQRRIAAILDKADAIRRKREQAITLADDLLKSTFLEMFGDPYMNIRNWPKTTLGEALHAIESGKSPRCDTRPAQAGEFGVLKVSAISSTAFERSENKAVLEGYKPDERHLIKKGDLLFSRKNTYELVGASAIVEDDVDRLAMPDLIFRLVPRRDFFVTEFLWCALVQPTVREAMRRLAGGAAASMPNIGKARLSELELIKPPLELQQKFATAYRTISLAREQQLNHITHSRALFISLSQRAFRGEL